jgi:nitrogen fixation-related uncharacterized protein
MEQSALLELATIVTPVLVGFVFLILFLWSSGKSQSGGYDDLISAFSRDDHEYEAGDDNRNKPGYMMRRIPGTERTEWVKETEADRKRIRKYKKQEERMRKGE